MSPSLTWTGEAFTPFIHKPPAKVSKEFLRVCRTMYLLGYIPKDNRLYLGDTELNVVSYVLVLSVLEYQTAVMRKDFSTADGVLPTIPREQRIRVAYFLEEQVQPCFAFASCPSWRYMCWGFADT